MFSARQVLVVDVDLSHEVNKSFYEANPVNNNVNELQQELIVYQDVDISIIPDE